MAKLAWVMASKNATYPLPTAPVLRVYTILLLDIAIYFFCADLAFLSSQAKKKSLFCLYFYSSFFTNNNARSRSASSWDICSRGGVVWVDRSSLIVINCSRHNPSKKYLSTFFQKITVRVDEDVLYITGASNLLGIHRENAIEYCVFLTLCSLLWGIFSFP